MSITATCSNIFRAAGTGSSAYCPDVREQPRAVTSAVPGQCEPASQGTGDVMAPTAVTDNHTGEDLMTRRQVACLFRVTSAAVATWARRGRLPEVRDQAGKPRYRRADVEALFRSGSRRRVR
jgi:hypothetical protein